ncbi:hypothetical protein [Streptomyces sp. NPDC058086]|uniref:hypothetical protein n=1 Tax=Streptomyces sp. NPDC058086 TaxID=3346334 RepID=UPI0036E2B0EF
MDSPIWAMLSAAERSAVGGLIQQDHRIAAVARVREAFRAESRPGLYETLDVVAERYLELGPTDRVISDPAAEPGDTHGES